MNSSPWMLTAGGQDYRLAGPQVLLGNAPSLRDIAHHLSTINRYTGAASRPYSVAEHSLLCERIADSLKATPIVRLAVLMHDAHEAYTNDLSSPSKACLGTTWSGFEATHAANVRHHFGLKTVFASSRAMITRCDLVALATERRDLMPFDPAVNEPWPVLDRPGAEIRAWDAEQLDAEEPPLPWRAMRQAFIDRYLLLSELVKAGAAGLAGAQA